MSCVTADAEENCFFHMDISSSRNVKVSCSDVSTHLKKNALVAGGLLRRDQIEYFSSLGFDVKDYYKREELV